jgi:hypothetical protein
VFGGRRGRLVRAQPCEAVKVGRVERSSGHLCYCSKDSTNKEGEERRHSTGRQKEGNMSATAFTLAAVAIRATLQLCSGANALLEPDRKTSSKWQLKTVYISQKAKFISNMKTVV